MIDISQDSRNIIINLHQLDVNIKNPGIFGQDSCVIMDQMMQLMMYIHKNDSASYTLYISHID